MHINLIWKSHFVHKICIKTVIKMKCDYKMLNNTQVSILTTAASSHFCSHRCWTRQRITDRESFRLQLRWSECGSSKWEKWRPSITPSTSATSTSRRNVWLPKCGVPSPTWTPSSLLCAGGRCVNELQNKLQQWMWQVTSPTGELRLGLVMHGTVPRPFLTSHLVLFFFLEEVHCVLFQDVITNLWLPLLFDN